MVALGASRHRELALSVLVLDSPADVVRKRLDRKSAAIEHGLNERVHLSRIPVCSQGRRKLVRDDSCVNAVRSLQSCWQCW